MNGQRRCGTYTHWNTLSYKKEQNNVICSSMDGPRGIMGFSPWLMGKESTCSAGAVDLIPALRRSPGDSLHFSCLRHPMDRAWRAVVHRAGLKRLSMSMGMLSHHTKWSTSERERQMPYDITYMWNLNYDTNELICETETDTENRLVVAKGGGEEERDGEWVWS